MKTETMQNSTAEQYFLSMWHKPFRTKTNKNERDVYSKWEYFYLIWRKFVWLPSLVGGCAFWDTVSN